MFSVDICPQLGSAPFREDQEVLVLLGVRGRAFITFLPEHASTPYGKDEISGCTINHLFTKN